MGQQMTEQSVLGICHSVARAVVSSCLLAPPSLLDSVFLEVAGSCPGKLCLPSPLLSLLLLPNLSASFQCFYEFCPVLGFASRCCNVIHCICVGNLERMGVVIKSNVNMSNGSVSLLTPAVSSSWISSKNPYRLLGLVGRVG